MKRRPLSHTIADAIFAALLGAIGASLLLTYL